MKTEVARADDPMAVRKAVELITQSEVVAIPTDTVYGLAADGFNSDAVEKLFVIKDRPASKAIMLLLGDAEELELVADVVSPTTRRLAENFWPGGLTLVVPARATLPANLRAETNTIGVRLANSALVTRIARELGHPLAATSANRSGGLNPLSVQDVLSDLNGRFPLILDGGSSPKSLPSTVIDCTVDPPRVLRAGAIPVSEIEAELNMVLEN
jgi:L-threonylcarbamoyladenylate synthase